jgi:hypothetical protein
MTDKSIIVKGYDISNQILHGLTPDQYIELLEYQDFKCWLSGLEFGYSEKLKKFVDSEYDIFKKIVISPNDPKNKGIAPAIDHDHKTGNIRSILNRFINYSEGELWTLDNTITGFEKRHLQMFETWSSGEYIFFDEHEVNLPIYKVYKNWNKIIKKLESIKIKDDEDDEADLGFLFENNFSIKSFDGSTLELFLGQKNFYDVTEYPEDTIARYVSERNDDYTIIKKNIDIIKKTIKDTLNEDIKIEMFTEVERVEFDDDRAYAFKKGKDSEFQLPSSYRDQIREKFIGKYKPCDSLNRKDLQAFRYIYKQYGVILSENNLKKYPINPPAIELFGHIKFK